MNLEIRWALDLITLDQERSISKAADKRYISQSAFSRRLQHLEETVGFNLIDRHAKEISFTELGQVLLTTAYSLQSQLNESMHLIDQMKHTKENTIKFAVAHSLVNSFFADYLRFVPIEEQGIKFEIIAINIGEGLKLLKEGKIDFLVSYSSKSIKQKAQSESLVAVKIGETEIIPVFAPLNAEKTFDLSTDFPLLTYSNNAYLRHLVDQVIENNNLNCHILYETDNAENLKQLVLQGAGVAWLPRITIAEELKQKKLIELSTAEIVVTQNIFIYKNKLNNHELTNLVLDHFKQKEY
ncbi:LysR substrate-binding domain-containing protein [Acinetobacter sp. MD2(2019)]|uniref:LysR substrate-binding domain-containing protein n=1 Tax=Acinetobacter sp. MD2(2019) TaxID=2605273 RepID=UPI002D1EDC03|nr:LysR substrate-binding domain-containing protein [Acinetobacter sp. MD2(2019)]MEB3753862.1 LysR family transcriptional regulator [Acinetobacter sp. MD2(2019)]